MHRILSFYSYRGKTFYYREIPLVCDATALPLKALTFSDLKLHTPIPDSKSELVDQFCSRTHLFEYPQDFTQCLDNSFVTKAKYYIQAS